MHAEDEHGNEAWDASEPVLPILRIAGHTLDGSAVEQDATLKYSAQGGKFCIEDLWRTPNDAFRWKYKCGDVTATVLFDGLAKPVRRNLWLGQFCDGL